MGAKRGMVFTKVKSGPLYSKTKAVYFVHVGWNHKTYYKNTRTYASLSVIIIPDFLMIMFRNTRSFVFFFVTWFGGALHRNQESLNTQHILICINASGRGSPT